MSDFQAIGAEIVIAALREKTGPIGESLAQCFDLPVSLQVGNTQLFDAGFPPPDLTGPGLQVLLTLGTQTMLCAIPGTLLPEWYTQPDMSQKSRLDTLAMEWSLNCLPDDFPAELFRTETTTDLWGAIVQNDPPPDVTLLELQLTSSTGDMLPSVWLVWPVTCPVESASAPAPPVAAATTLRSSFPEGMPPAQFARPPESPSARLHRLLNLPVPIIVKLAEKKIELGQLLAIGPGAIVSFEKSCEDLLDLYVNNRLYGRGEAVKIGEKFGIKVNEVGTVEERISAVFNPR